MIDFDIDRTWCAHHDTTAVSRSTQKHSRVLQDGDTLRTIPRNLLRGPARWALTAVGYHGQIYAFPPLGKDPEDIVIWVDILAQTDPDHNGWVRLHEWRMRWRAYYRLCARSYAALPADRLN